MSKQANDNIVQMKKVTLVSLAGAKYAIHLGEELQEFAVKLEEAENLIQLGSWDDQTVHRGQVANAYVHFKELIFEAMDVSWLVRFVSQAKAFTTEVPLKSVKVPLEWSLTNHVQVALTSENEFGYYRVDDTWPEYGEKQRYLLNDLLRYRNVLRVDRAVEILQFLQSEGTLKYFYADWVARNIERGRDANNYWPLESWPRFFAFWHALYPSGDRPEPVDGKGWEVFGPFFATDKTREVWRKAMSFGHGYRGDWKADQYGWWIERNQAE